MEIVLLSALTFKLEAPVKQCEQSYINRYINFYRCGFAILALSLSNTFSLYLTWYALYMRTEKCMNGPF